MYAALLMVAGCLGHPLSSVPTDPPELTCIAGLYSFGSHHVVVVRDGYGWLAVYNYQGQPAYVETIQRHDHGIYAGEWWSIQGSGCGYGAWQIKGGGIEAYGQRMERLSPP